MLYGQLFMYQYTLEIDYGWFTDVIVLNSLGGGLVETYMAPLAPRGLAAALNASGKYMFRPPEFEVDHLIVGAGKYATRIIN